MCATVIDPVRTFEHEHHIIPTTYGNEAARIVIGRYVVLFIIHGHIYVQDHSRRR